MKKLFTLLKLLIIKLLKVKSDIILFTSFNGRYCDNPKYISEAIYKLNKKIKIVWLVNENVTVPDYVKVVKINSCVEVIYRGIAKVIVDNVYCLKYSELCKNSAIDRVFYSINCWIRKKKGQKCYTTWHGTPLKKMGRDQIGNTIIDNTLESTEMVLGNTFTQSIMNHLLFEKVKISILGTPRNDLLFQEGNNSYFRDKLKLYPKHKRIALFAPSFRTTGSLNDINRSGIDQLNMINIPELCDTLTKRFGGEWLFACRFHYHVDKAIDWNELNMKYGNLIINANIGEDMVEYLSISDILITDVSSCMFDFALTNKPCFLFFPDFDIYLNNERGMYSNITDLPFPFSKDYPSLIKSIQQFDNNLYCSEIEHLKKTYGYYEDGKSSERIAKYIIDSNF